MNILQLATAATTTAVPRQVRVLDWYRFDPVLNVRPSCTRSSASLPSLGLDEQFMRLALQQAQAAFDADEVPIGAVLVCGSEVLSTGQNATETRRNPLAHAELQCIMTAAESRQAWRLQDATLYCTVEPCPMCAGAILQARLQRLVYGARQPRLGADGSWVALFPPQAAVPVNGQQDEAPGELYTRLDVTALMHLIVASS
jgi:tRNA(adenine34) deaminase